MSRDSDPAPGTDREPSNVPASDDLSTTTGPGRQRRADWSELDAGLDDGEDEFSWFGPEVYFPLLVGGLALVAFPDPVTTVVGLVSIAIGLGLAVLDLRSPSGEVA